MFAFFFLMKFPDVDIEDDDDDECGVRCSEDARWTYESHYQHSWPGWSQLPVPRVTAPPLHLHSFTKMNRTIRTLSYAAKRTAPWRG